MDEAKGKVTCPDCGNTFEPPAGIESFFCSRCGKRLSWHNADQSAGQAAQRSYEKTQQATNLALDAVRQAVELAQAGASPADTRAALAAARQAMEAAQIAQQAQQAMADAQVAAAAAAEAARLTAQSQAAAQAQAEAAARAQAEAAAQAQAETEAAACAQAQAQAQAAAQTQPSTPAEATSRAQAPSPSGQAPVTPAQPTPIEYRRGATVRSTATGHGLFTVTLPTTWKLADAVLSQGSSSSRPYKAFARFTEGGTASMTLTLGDAGVRNSAGMEALMAQYGAAIAAVDRANYAPMPAPRPTADATAVQAAKALGGSDLTCVREFGGIDLPRRQREANDTFTRLAKASGSAIVRDPFAAEMVRLYSLAIGGIAYKLAVYVRIYAMKDGSGVDMINPMGLLFNLGSALGNRMNKKKSAKKGADAPASAGGADVAQSDGKPICLPAFGSYVDDGTIYWDVAGIATVAAPADQFDHIYLQAFLPLVSSYWVHDDLLSLAAADTRQQAAAVQQATNIQIQQMNQQHQAMQAAARQVQAAADARFEAWQRQSDAHHAAFRERTNAPFRDGGTGGGAGGWSEAIRGVNTFVTSDGREVELDVSADRAYENQAGDVIGGSGGFDPGANWNEIPRA